MDDIIQLEEEEAVEKGVEKREGVPKTREKFPKEKASKVSKVEKQQQKVKLSTLGPKGMKKLTWGTNILGSRATYFREDWMKKGLAEAQQELTMEGYGRFPIDFFNSGLWRATQEEPSNQQVGLIKHATEDGGRVNVFNLRSAQDFSFGEEAGMTWKALKLARKEPMKAPEPTINPFLDQMPFGDCSPLPR